MSGSRPALNVSIMFTTTAIYFVAGQKLPDLSKLTLISRVYVVSLVVNLLLTAVSVFSTAMNLVTQVCRQGKASRGLIRLQEGPDKLATSRRAR